MNLKEKESFGQYLRRERLLREIRLDEVAQFTKIKLSTLTSLENDDFSHLPSIAFVRGFIRAYAEYLGLNVSEVMLRFTAFMDENHPELVASPKPEKYAPVMRRSLLLGLFAIIILGFFFYSYQYMKSLERRPAAVGSQEGSTAEITAATDTTETPVSPPAQGQDQIPKSIQLTATESVMIIHTAEVPGWS